jgi:phosphonoacetaldehyde hydrolase
MIKAVIFDWAGTIVDHGSRAPMGAFVRAFAQFGVDLTIAQARGPMGMAKRDHIRLVCADPAVKAAWEAKHGHAPTEADIDAILAVFEPMNVASVADHADFIPGAKEMLADLKRQGIRIGSTTGYTRKIMAALMPIAAAEGYVPEITVCAGDLPEGRPSPLMMWYAMARMGIWPAADVVKVDDTPPGIGEGRNAGTWTVGLALTGNIAGLSAAELADLSEDDRGALRATATKEMERAGAHFIIDSVAQLPEALRYFNARLARGETPAS